MPNTYKIDPKWIQWFIGFVDAEGNFQTFPKKRLKNSIITHYNIGYGFHLGMSLRDLTLIKTIRSNLNNLGRIYEYAENKNEAHLAITKLEHLKWVILNIFDHFPLLTDHQWERFSRLRYGVLTQFNRAENYSDYIKFLEDHSTWLKARKINLNDLSLFDNWISGFINGEGSFSIQAKGVFAFYIEHTDKNVLELIRKRMQFGPKVNFRAGRQEGRKDTYVLSISSKKDLESLIQFFSNDQIISLQGYKKDQYERWLSEYTA